MTRPDARRGARPTRLCLSAAVLALIAGCSSTLPRDAAASLTLVTQSFAASLGLPTDGPRTRRLDTPLAPAARPARPVVQPIDARDPRTGETLRLDPRPIGRGRVEVRQSDGCTWRRDDWFAPSVSWSGCGDSANWRDGSATVSGGAGLWPLKVGAETRFSRRATSATGRNYTRDTTCRVRDAVAVLRDGRTPTPAFVVDCNDGKRVRTTWWAPGEGPVAFRQTHRDKGIEQVWIAR